VYGNANLRRHHLDEFERLVRVPWHSPEEMDLLRSRRLSWTVARAVAHSPFYRELLGADCQIPDRIDDIGSLPVTSKSDLRDSDLDRARPLRWRRSRPTWGTSGSSGEPYTFGVDSGYAARHDAQRAFVYFRAGLPLGSRLVEVLGGGNALINDPPGTGTHRNDPYPTFERIRVGSAIDRLPEAVSAARPQLLYGNRSHLLQIADWADASEQHSIHPDLVCSSSEMLLAEDESRLASVFEAGVLEVYGSSEASNIAFRLPGESTWRVLEPRVIVEVLDEDRVPVKSGGSGEIVVTTLTEPTSPLIRYATGDLARVHSGPSDGTSGLMLAALEGRSADSLLDEDGRRVNFWSVATDRFWSSSDVARHVQRWQVHQRPDRSLIVSLEMTRDGDIGQVATAIRHHLVGTLGDLPIEVVVKDRVHVAGSGKFRAVTSDASGGAG
jgi:phenylacetate-CoA ligase